MAKDHNNSASSNSTNSASTTTVSSNPLPQEEVENLVGYNVEDVWRDYIDYMEHQRTKGWKT